MTINAGSTVIIAKNVLNYYAEPDSSTELVTQNLIGETARVIESRDDWAYLEGWDGYRGWVMSRFLVEQPADRPLYASSGKVAIISSLFAEVYSSPDTQSDILTKATVSAELEVVDEMPDWLETALPDGRRGFIRDQDSLVEDRSQESLPLVPTGKELVKTARRFIGVPYLWGGTSPFGIDCSGFMQLIHRIHGVTLLRDANMQAELDERACPVEVEDLQPGDLVFFARRIQEGDPRITHVGMSLGGKMFIHSAGSPGVTINSLDDEDYGKKYWGARRMDLEGSDCGKVFVDRTHASQSTP